jgi:hypothetical protein
LGFLRGNPLNVKGVRDRRSLLRRVGSGVKGRYYKVFVFLKTPKSKYRSLTKNGFNRKRIIKRSDL